MTKANLITEFQKTIIRRINRQFQIVWLGVLVKAILPLPVQETRKDNCIHRTFNQHIVVENTGAEFRAEYFLQAQWKRVYWTRWRDYKVNHIVLTDTNFDKLIKRLKAEIELLAN